MVGWGGQNTPKSSWVEPRRGRRDHSPVIITGRNQTELGEKKPKSIYQQGYKSKIMTIKTKS